MGCPLGKTARRQRRVRKGFRKLEKETKTEVAKWDANAKLTQPIIESTKKEIAENETELNNKLNELRRIKQLMKGVPEEDKARRMALLNEARTLDLVMNNLRIAIFKGQNILTKAKMQMDGKLFEISFRKAERSKQILGDIWDEEPGAETDEHAEFYDSFVEEVQEQDFHISGALGEQKDALFHIDTTLEMEGFSTPPRREEMTEKRQTRQRAVSPLPKMRENAEAREAYDDEEDGRERKERNRAKLQNRRLVGQILNS